MNLCLQRMLPFYTKLKRLLGINDQKEGINIAPTILTKNSEADSAYILGKFLTYELTRRCQALIPCKAQMLPESPMSLTARRTPTRALFSFVANQYLPKTPKPPMALVKYFRSTHSPSGLPASTLSSYRFLSKPVCTISAIKSNGNRRPHLLNTAS